MCARLLQAGFEPGPIRELELRAASYDTMLSAIAGSSELQLSCRTGFESRLQQPCKHSSFATVYLTVPTLGDWVQSPCSDHAYPFACGGCLRRCLRRGGSVRCTYPYALTYWTTLHTLLEPRAASYGTTTS